MRKGIRFFAILIAIVFVVALSSCSGCSGSNYRTLYEQEKSKASNNEEDNAKFSTTVSWVIAKIDEKKVEILKEAYKTDDDEEIADKELTEEQFNALKDYAKKLIGEYPIYSAISGEKKIENIERNYKTQFILADIKDYELYLDKATVASKDLMPMDEYANATKVDQGCMSCFKAQTNTSAISLIKNVKDSNNIYEIVATFTLQVNQRMQEGEPLHFYARDFGDFMGHFFNNLFVFPVGWLLYALSNLFGGFYIVGLLITTLLIRTLGWPIYAKTNDMSIKMKAIEGDVQKIQAKYANRKDPDSQRMMQMEQARLYKQNGIGLGGCLLPFLQFPIFMAVYRAISRIPYTVARGDYYTLDWANKVKPQILGINLFEDYTYGKVNLIGIIILVILVAGTQFISQLLSELRQKKAKDKVDEDIPAYRRQAVKQQASDQQRSMKMVMYFMIVMMAVFVWTSKAGLGVYWLIGNCYSMLQMYINSKQSEKKLKLLKQKKEAERNGIAMPYKVQNDKKDKKNK